MSHFCILLATLACLFLTGARAQADANIQILASFVPAPDGLNPSTLIAGKDGNFYGMTSSGGAYNAGTIFRLTPNGFLSTVHSFNGPVEGTNPNNLLQARDGNFYGTTCGDNSDPATFFKLTPKGVFTVLSSFGTGQDLQANLVQGHDGNFYVLDGNAAFHITPAGGLTNLGTVPGANTGDAPTGPMAIAADGTIYGIYFGTIFTIATDGTITPLVQSSHECFTALVLLPGGNFYGLDLPQNEGQKLFSMTPDGTVSFISTSGGPAFFQKLMAGTDGFLYGIGPDFSSDHGAILKLTLAGEISTVGTFQVLDQFSPGSGSFAQGKNGTFYGVNSLGGTLGQGIAFSVSRTGATKVLHTFENEDGIGPASDLVEDSRGSFYGVTLAGGSAGMGTVFQMNSRGALKTLHSFSGPDGNQPNNVVVAKDGNLYGTATLGGNPGNSGGNGTVFRLSPKGIFQTIHKFSLDLYYPGPVYLNSPGPLMVAQDGSMWGVVESYTGSIFKVTTSGSCSVTANLPADFSLGYFPMNVLAQAKDGTFYGASGSYTGSGIFHYSPTSGF